MPVLIFVAFAILAVAMWWLGSVQARRRREELRAWAAARGFRYLAESCDGAPAGAEGFDLLGRGRRRCAANLIAGTVSEGTVTVFDWRYVTGSGKNQHAHRCTAVLLRPPCRLGGLRIREEGILDRLAELAGFNDIDFESAAFSRAFHVSAGDRRWAYDVVTQPNMELLLRSPRFHIEMAAGGILLWREGRHLDPGECDAAIALAGGLMAGIHPAVRRDLGLAT